MRFPSVVALRVVPLQRNQVRAEARQPAETVAQIRKKPSSAMPPGRAKSA